MWHRSTLVWTTHVQINTAQFLVHKATWTHIILCSGSCNQESPPLLPDPTFQRTGRQQIQRNQRRLPAEGAKQPRTARIAGRTSTSLFSSQVALVVKNSPATVATAAKSLQSCPTLCDPIDRSPPGSPVPGILQARTLE